MPDVRGNAANGGSEHENAASETETNSDRNSDNHDETAVAPASKASDVMKRIAGGGGGGGAAATSTNDDDPAFFKLAPFNPSSDQIQNMALKMLSLTAGDVLFDLGCGDGRFLCHAATRIAGLNCVGIEIDPEYVSRGKDRVEASGLESAVDIRHEDATKVVTTAAVDAVEGDSGNGGNGELTATDDTDRRSVTDLTLADDATALYLFILPKGIVKMMPILNSLKERRLKSGKRFRVLSYMFGIHDWEPTVVDETARGSCPVYYYDFGGA